MKTNTIKLNRICILLLVFIFALTLVACDNNSTKASNAIIYEVLSGNGGVVVRNDTEEELYVGMRIQTGDVIKTDSESEVYIRIDDTKNILLGISSIIEVTEHSSGKLILTLVEGDCFFDVTEKLTEGEVMSFNISNSSMSIRGTSGTLKSEDGVGKFTILTGKGSVKNKSEDGEEKEVSLYPNTKVTFSTNSENNNFNIGIVETSDLPNVFTEYVNTVEEYAGKLEDEGWNISEGEMTPPEEVEMPEGDNPLLGYREDANGNWIFNQEDYDKGYGPTYYGAIYNNVYPDKPTLTCEASKYTAESQTANVIGYDSRYMNIKNNVQKKVKEYIITVTPKAKWSDGTTDEVTVKWEIYYNELDIDDKTFTFEWTGKAQTFNLKTKYSNAVYLYKGDDGNWSRKKPSYTDIGTYEVEVLIQCPTYLQKKIIVTTEIVPAVLTWEPYYRDDEFLLFGVSHYDEERKGYVAVEGFAFSPRARFTNGDGNEVTLSLYTYQQYRLVWGKEYSLGNNKCFDFTIELASEMANKCSLKEKETYELILVSIGDTFELRKFVKKENVEE